MILDSSVLVAILLLEPGYQELLARIIASPGVGIGAPTLVETVIVLAARLRGDPTAVLKELLGAIGAEVIPFTEDHFRAALRAYLKFGKGRHPAALNFGDCLCYAVASIAREPLLYVGDDFSRTDLRKA
jgi:ribonuclease VapC